ncbi:AraC family transcriptional regulator [Pseudomonas alkylphenolica]|uniref:AraC family transcriptional regulator n=1 Tax=Pseudomonas alkylphenolica TaxID=237609 RepID=A0A077FB07_9PSED|nr:AraC family transcriptional regulator [Pseudomonas alkylphenolica]AIL61755.1 AraC family transcriptional regulator [Pseudomonas alkylphenolica]
MAVNPFVRALSLCHFEDFACSQGLKADDMLRRSSLPLELLKRQEGILSYRRFCALLELCARESGNPLYGLQYGLHQGVSIFGPLLYLIRNASTVGEALEELRQNYSLQNGAAEVGFEIEGSLAVLSYHISDQELSGVAQAEELATGIGIQLMRTLVGSHWQPGAVLLRHLPLAEPAAYRRTLGFLPTFSANCPGLMFDAAVLALPLAASDQMLHGLIAQHIECMERLTPDELPNYVRQLLRNLLPSGRVTIEKVADCMALNPRTLQRKLAQEDTAFQVLLDQTRQHLAQQYLEDASISVAQMAGLLGYADLTAFCRAFHRWFGVTPREWKKRQHPGLQPRLLRSRHLRALR